MYRNEVSGRLYAENFLEEVVLIPLVLAEIVWIICVGLAAVILCTCLWVRQTLRGT